MGHQHQGGEGKDGHGNVRELMAHFPSQTQAEHAVEMLADRATTLHVKTLAAPEMQQERMRAEAGVSTVEIDKLAWLGFAIGIIFGAILGALIYADQIAIPGLARALSGGRVAASFLGAGILGALGWLLGAAIPLLSKPRAEPIPELCARVEQEKLDEVEQILVDAGAYEVLVSGNGEMQPSKKKPMEHKDKSHTESKHGAMADAQDHTQGVPSTVAIMGHPIHPILVPFPIAFWVGALGSDLAYWWTADAFWAQVSLWLVGAGFITGAVAGLVGLFDFISIPRAREHRDGWIHAIGNGAALIIALVSWLTRLGDPTTAVVPVGLALSLLTVLIITITGWFGGELAYRHMIGVTGHRAEHDKAGESGDEREPSEHKPHQHAAKGAHKNH